ncbi:inner-membrane translocator [Rhodopseudomonas palustris HaA2]|uniref:Inner-membrane translocator n=1 Tax=Rhodopseudomonas palustris (strain HaA2) TaxID=316058 RepID=Q2IZ57_RHOP2|nr:inner-membrane translocator [Rhodopseudomonas palustris HaA2]
MPLIHLLRPLLSRLLFAAVALVVLHVATQPALAGPYEDAVAQFAAGSFSDTEEAIGRLVASAHPRAATIIVALQDGRLFADPDAKTVFIKAGDGAISNAVTGEAVAALPAKAEAVRLNNKLRRAVSGAMAGLTLLSPDLTKRIQAAQSVFKTHDETMLPTVETALQAEKNAAARQAFAEARASILLFKTDASDVDKLDAIATLKARGDQEAMALLTGVPGGQSAAVASGIASAKAAIERNLALWSMVQNAWYGLSLGSVLLLAAIGLAITFGVMGVINMAHGEMVMLGAYTTFVVQETIRTSYPALFDYSLLIAVPLAFLVAGAIGVLIERSVIRFLYGRPLETLLATWGLSLILQQAVRTLFGPTNREVGNPSWMSGAFELGQITITYNRLWILCFTLAVFVILLAMLRYTALGLEMRAVTQNRRMAASMGIATSRVDALTFGLGSGIAGIAGVALSQIDNVSPNLGQSYIIDSFMVVVFGGVGNLWGTLVGAFTLGIANKFLEPVAGAVLAKIAILVLIILFIQKRPRGLFALKGRAVEA